MSQTARPGREWRLPVCQARLQPVADAGLELMSREGKERDNRRRLERKGEWEWEDETVLMSRIRYNYNEPQLCCDGFGLNYAFIRER